MKELETSSIEAYAALILGAAQWIAGLWGIVLNFWIGAALWLVVIALLVDFVCRSRWTMDWRWWAKAAISLIIIAGVVRVSWGPARQAYRREHAPLTPSAKSSLKNPTDTSNIPTPPPLTKSPESEPKAKRRAKKTAGSTELPSQHIEQKSEGPNSPNIVGNNAQVTYQNASRTLSGDQRTRLQEILSKSPPQEIHIVAYSSSEDAARYASEIANAISFAGWKSSVSLMIATDLDVVPGLVLVVPTSSPLPQNIAVLKQAFDAAALPVSVKADSIASKEAFLWVGARP